MSLVKRTMVFLSTPDSRACRGSPRPGSRARGWHRHRSRRSNDRRTRGASGGACAGCGTRSRGRRDARSRCCRMKALARLVYSASSCVERDADRRRGRRPRRCGRRTRRGHRSTSRSRFGAACSGAGPPPPTCPPPPWRSPRPRSSSARDGVSAVSPVRVSRGPRLAVTRVWTG